MIVPHLTYCLTSWAQASSTTLKSIHILHKQTLKTLDKKTKSHHHCNILTKHHILSWENLIKFTDVCLVFKIVHGMAPPPLSDFVNQSTRLTRSVSRGDCVISHRSSSFSKSTFSVKAAHSWNALPPHIRTQNTYKTFKHSLKEWLVANQVCKH